MTQIRQFKVTTPRSPDGFIYSYNKASELFVGIDFNQQLSYDGTTTVIKEIKPSLNEFMAWAKNIKGMEVVELSMDITFLMFWDKYNDKSRSSKKKCEAMWNRLSAADRVKAYYHVDTYNRHRGNAEKKYCETYLSAELWNN